MNLWDASTLTGGAACLQYSLYHDIDERCISQPMGTKTCMVTVHRSTAHLAAGCAQGTPRARAYCAAGARETVEALDEDDACVCDESPDAEVPAVRKRVLVLRGAMMLACAALSLAALRGGYADAAGGDEIDGVRVA